MSLLQEFEKEPSLTDSLFSKGMSFLSYFSWPNTGQKDTDTNQTKESTEEFVCECEMNYDGTDGKEVNCLNAQNFQPDNWSQPDSPSTEVSFSVQTTATAHGAVTFDSNKNRDDVKDRAVEFSETSKAARIESDDRNGIQNMKPECESFNMEEEATTNKNEEALRKKEEEEEEALRKKEALKKAEEDQAFFLKAEEEQALRKAEEEQALKKAEEGREALRKEEASRKKAEEQESLKNAEEQEALKKKKKTEEQQALRKKTKEQKRKTEEEVEEKMKLEEETKRNKNRVENSGMTKKAESKATATKGAQEKVSKKRTMKTSKEAARKEQTVDNDRRASAYEANSTRTDTVKKERQSATRQNRSPDFTTSVQVNSSEKSDPFENFDFEEKTSDSSAKVHSSEDSNSNSDSKSGMKSPKRQLPDINISPFPSSSSSQLERQKKSKREKKTHLGKQNSLKNRGEDSLSMDSDESSPPYSSRKRSNAEVSEVLPESKVESPKKRKKKDPAELGKSASSKARNARSTQRGSRKASQEGKNSKTPFPAEIIDLT